MPSPVVPTPEQLTGPSSSCPDLLQRTYASCISKGAELSGRRARKRGGGSSSAFQAVQVSAGMAFAKYRLDTG